MKKKILLIDESLTVQKVVALTLDKSRYLLAFAKSRSEVMKMVVEQLPDLILLSDQMGDINAASFPKEMETWLGGMQAVPPVILVTSNDIKDQKHYAGVLKKPFTPQALQGLINDKLQAKERAFPDVRATVIEDDFEDQRLHKIFNDTFADESTLMHETFNPEEAAAPSVPPRPLPTERRESPRPQNNSWNEAEAVNLWDVDKAESQQSALNSFANQSINKSATSDEIDGLWNLAAAQGTFAPEERPARAAENLSNPDFEQKVAEKIHAQDLQEAVDKALNQMLPAIVEKLVRERLDRLLAEQERFIELKQ